VTPAEVASGVVAVVIAPVIVEVASVTLVAVASPAKSVVFAIGVSEVASPAEVASGETALVKPAAVARPEVADVTPALVARPERSETFDNEPEVRVASVKLRVPYVQTLAAVNILSDVDVPPVIVLVGAYVPFQTSAANAPNAVSVRAGLAQTCAAVILLRPDIAPVIVPVDAVTLALVARPVTAVVS
jgi:hypothetical protein